MGLEHRRRFDSKARFVVTMIEVRSYIFRGTIEPKVILSTWSVPSAGRSAPPVI
jgi:hypothetical protein